jgi:hypothetical protein
MVERMGFSWHLLHGVISTALGPQELLGLGLKELRLWVAGSPGPGARLDAAGGKSPPRTWPRSRAHHW